jgi:hypothetical protein
MLAIFNTEKKSREYSYVYGLESNRLCNSTNLARGSNITNIKKQNQFHKVTMQYVYIRKHMPTNVTVATCLKYILSNANVGPLRGSHGCHVCTVDSRKSKPTKVTQNSHVNFYATTGYITFSTCRILHLAPFRDHLRPKLLAGPCNSGEITRATTIWSPQVRSCQLILDAPRNRVPSVVLVIELHLSILQTRLLPPTGHCYGVVSSKASHSLRPFYYLLCSPFEF